MWSSRFSNAGKLLMAGLVVAMPFVPSAPAQTYGFDCDYALSEFPDRLGSYSDSHIAGLRDLLFAETSPAVQDLGVPLGEDLPPDPPCVPLVGVAPIPVSCSMSDTWSDTCESLPMLVNVDLPDFTVNGGAMDTASGKTASCHGSASGFDASCSQGFSRRGSHSIILYYNGQSNGAMKASHMDGSFTAVYWWMDFYSGKPADRSSETYGCHQYSLTRGHLIDQVVGSLASSQSGQTRCVTGAAYGHFGAGIWTRQ